jgi:hypothetical protein
MQRERERETLVVSLSSMRCRPLALFSHPTPPDFLICDKYFNVSIGPAAYR